MNVLISEEARLDLVAGQEWIAADNPTAAEGFLVAAFDCFDRLGQFPEMGPLARIKGADSGLRFAVLSPPYNHFIVFYRISGELQIDRIIYGAQDWRGTPGKFFQPG